MDKLIEISTFGKASVKNNKVIVDYSELKKLTKNHYQLLDALKGLVASISGGEKPCGHDFTCVCAGDAAREAIKEAE